MSATLPKLSATGRAVTGKRAEVGRLPAAMFALVIHIGFFALIVFGVSWQVKAPQPLSAEIWRELPSINAPKPPPVAEVEPKPTPPPEPKIEPKIVPPPKPVAPPAPTKADIALNEKKLRDEKLKLEAQKREQEKKKAEEDQRRIASAVAAQREAERNRAAIAEAQVQAAREAALRSARQKAVNDYSAKVVSLINNRANIPESVMGKPSVQIRVRLLVSGAVFDVQVVKLSGNRVYDEAIQRAINGIQQWPIPEDATIFGNERRLDLTLTNDR
jgi:colicin import membrane protein